MNENLALEKEILEQKRKDILKEVEQKKVSWNRKKVKFH